MQTEHLQCRVGDVLIMKKKHPCGSDQWEVLRTGADFRLKCAGCGHQMMISRKKVEKSCKSVKINGIRSK